MSDFPTIIPTMRYQDAHAAIQWLCNVLGFKKKVVFENADGGIDHAQLILDGSMIMLSSIKDVPFDKLVKPPDQIVGNYNTQSAYIIVEEIREHYERVKKAGGEIVAELKTEPYGTGYSCKDPEGYLWNLGDYNPWEGVND